MTHAPSRSRLAPWLWSLVTLAIVGGIVAAGLWTLRQPDVTTAAPAVATQPARVKVGHDYYIFVRLIELEPRKLGGGQWDRGGNTAPDPYYHLSWRGNRIFESASRSDSLIASWDLLRVDVKDLVTSGGQFDISSALNAPTVRIEPGERLTLQVWDDDPFGDDEALHMELPLDELYPGENVFTPSSAVKRVVVQVIDRQTPLADLIDMAAKR